MAWSGACPSMLLTKLQPSFFSTEMTLYSSFPCQPASSLPGTTPLLYQALLVSKCVSVPDLADAAAEKHMLIGQPAAPNMANFLLLLLLLPIPTCSLPGCLLEGLSWNHCPLQMDLLFLGGRAVCLYTVVLIWLLSTFAFICCPIPYLFSMPCSSFIAVPNCSYLALPPLSLYLKKLE